MGPNAAAHERARHPGRGAAAALVRAALVIGVALLPHGPDSASAAAQEQAAPAEPPGQAPAPAPGGSWALIEGARAEGAPGAEHRRLEPLVGRWLVEATWALSREHVVEARGTAENRWVLGGRYLESEMSFGEGGSRIHMLTYYGYSPDLDRYFALSMNDVTSTPDRAWGTYAQSSRSLLLTHRERDRETNTLRVRRRILTIEGLDAYSLELFVDPAGVPPVRTLEATFTRDLGEPP